MKVLMKELTDCYDIVIFDTPPVLRVVDSRLLSNQVDGVVFIVRNQYTEQHAAEKTVGKLRLTGCQIIGVILNGKSSKCVCIINRKIR